MSNPDPRHPGPETPVGRAITASLAKIPLPPNRPVRCALMFSGGLDSVSLLANLLATTDYEIHAHHIVLDNGERRAGAESRAVAASFAWCREHLRDFADSESGHTFPEGGGGGGWDTTLTMFHAARLTRSLPQWQIDLVITGHIRSGFRELSEGQAVFSAAMQSRRRRPPDWARPLAWLTATNQPERKADIATSIPAELVEHAWWCRRPLAEEDDWRPCESCHACTSMAAANELIIERGLAPVEAAAS